MIKNGDRYRATGKKQVEMEEFTELALDSIFKVYSQTEKVVVDSLSYRKRNKLMKYIISLIKEGLFDNKDLCDKLFDSIGSKDVNLDSDNFNIFVGKISSGSIERIMPIKVPEGKNYDKRILLFTWQVYDVVKRMMIDCAEKYSDPAREHIINIISNSIFSFIKDREDLHNKTLMKTLIKESYHRLFAKGNYPLPEVPKRDIDDIIKRVKSKLKDLK